MSSMDRMFRRVLPLTGGRDQIEARSAQASPWYSDGLGTNMM